MTDVFVTSEIDVGVTHPNFTQKDTNDKVFVVDQTSERVETFMLTVNDVNATYQRGPYTLDIGCT